MMTFASMRRSPTTVAAVAVVLALGCTAATATAQDADGPLRLRGVELRLPDAMNEEPLQLVGIEQGDNDFRSRTPALQRTAQRVAKVSTAALHDRRLALFDGNSPLRVETARVRAEAPKRLEDLPTVEGPGIGLGISLMLFTAAVAFGALMAWRFYSQWRRRPAEPA